MNKLNKGIVNPLSKSDLQLLIKRFGLQSWMFDERLLLFEWEGLEYEFYIIEDNIYLEKITVLRDVLLAGLDKFEADIRKPKHELPDFLK